MHRLIFSLMPVLLLLACVQPTAPVAVGRFRDANAAMYSNAQLDTQRLVGQWTQVAGFGPAEAKCKPGGVDISQTAGGLQLNYRLCQSGTDMRGTGPMRPVGPGRFAVVNQPGPWWVLWADVDYRTLVIGTPSGQLGFILNRDGALPPDRLAAAREILDWNGYDLTRLRVYP